jgi:thiamine pyrophosphokinase
MKSALIFLNGHYDLRYPQFYKAALTWAVENGHPLICADGGLRLFAELNQTKEVQFSPHVLIGDLDSLAEMPGDTIEQLERSGTHVVREWVGHVDKDDTDGQLAVAYAVAEYGCQSVLLYGGLPHPNGYEIDHFLGNLRLMRLGLRLFQENIYGDKHSWKAEMRDPLQTIHFVVSDVTLERKNDGVQRVSLISEDPNVTVEHSTNLRWSLDGLHVDPVKTNTLRNEFVAGADRVTIRLAEGADPVYVIHNWYG